MGEAVAADRAEAIAVDARLELAVEGEERREGARKITKKPSKKLVIVVKKGAAKKPPAKKKAAANATHPG